MNPRRLSFAVGTSLLTASLAAGTAGCNKPTANPGPEPPHVNEGPAPQPEDEPHVNEGPEGDEAAPEDAEPPDEPNVNTVPSK